MKGAEALIKGLEEEGVRHIFGIIGGATMDIYDVLYDHPTIKHITTRHEQVAAHAAAGYAKASGKTGTCFATSGPGAMNLVTGIADAFLDSVPIVAVTGQVPTTAIGGDAFQEADVVGVTMPITKYNYLIEDAESIPEIVKGAYYLANTKRPGPVLIDFPKDMQQAKLKRKSMPKKIEYEGYKPKLKGHPKQLKLASEALLKAEKPVIISGGGVITSGASKELVTFAELLGIPVISTMMGKGSFPENHPLYLGPLGMHGKKSANMAIQRSDVLFAIGCRFSDRITGNAKYFAPNAKIIHADIDPSEIGKNVRADIPIVGDARLILSDMLKIIDKKIKKGDHSAWIEDLLRYRRELSPDFGRDEFPVKPQKIITEVQKIIDEDQKKFIITTEVGRNQLWSFHLLKIKYPRHFLTSGGLGTMGSGFPYAIGAKVARPECTLLNMAGDGSFQMSMQDLATCKINDIPVVNIIFDDCSLGNVRMWQVLFFDKRYSETDICSNPNFEKIAEAYGGYGKRVTRVSEIGETIREAIDSGRPAIIDIPTDKDEMVFPMVPPGGILHEMIGD